MSKTHGTLLLFIISAISAFTLQTCKPEEEHKTYGPYTLGEGKDYLNFKPGSWWVYQNSKSGLYDTLVLKSINIRLQTFTGKNTVITEMVNMLIYSTTTMYEYKYYSSGANPDANPEYLDDPSIVLWLGKSKPGDFHGETVPFFYPFLSSYITGSPGEATYIGVDTIMLLKGKEYKKVIKFQQKKDACSDGWTGKYYWAQNVGLIKKETVQKDESWDLINYHVEKP